MKTITNDREYQAIIKRIDQLLDIVTDDNYNSIPEAVELDFLSTLIEEYERKHYPIAPPQLSDLKKSVSPSRRPAVMTIEELKKEVAEATEDVLKGNGIKHEDFMKEMKTWM